MKYEQRIVAFIDILGFSDIVNDTIDKKNGEDIENKINDVVSAYRVIHDILDLNEKSDKLSSRSNQSKKVAIFSDSIVISFKFEEPSEVFFTLMELKWLIMQLLSNGWLCRGAVSLGKLNHTDEYVFGPALIEAYLLESKAALYPRIILDRTVIDAGSLHSAVRHTRKMEAEYVEDLLELDSDGMYYIDYFSKAETELDDPMYDFPKYINNLGEIIRKGLMASSHHSKVGLRIKYSWMRERYNRMVSIVTKEDVIKGLEQSGEFEVADFYKELKQISPNKFK